MAQRRDAKGRFAGSGGGSVRSIKSDRTVKGGGESKRGVTRASRSARYNNEVNFRVSEHKAFAPYDKAVGKSSYANRKARKLEKSGADAATVAKAKKSADVKENTTRLMRQRFISGQRTAQRRYRNTTGLVQQRRYVKPG